jgi:hypothetical protein
MVRRFLIIDSEKTGYIDIPILTIPHLDNYIIFKDYNISKKIPKKIYNELLQKGLYKTIKNRTYDAFCALHRLVVCLYDNILDLSIHHIDKDKCNNSIHNLVPIPQEHNSSLDSLPYEEMLKEGKELQNKWFKTFDGNRKRMTVAQNVYLQIDILKMSTKENIKKTIKHFKTKIKSERIIRTIINLIHYKVEFLKWLELYHR